MKKIVPRLASAGFAGIFLWCGSCAVCEGPLDYYVYKSRANQIPLPPGTTMLDHQDAFGLTVGNGNHCDYLIRRLIRTARTQKELERYFTDKTIPAPSDVEEGDRIGATIYSVSEGDLRNVPDTWRRYENDPRVFVVEYLASRDPGLDVRCR